MIAIVRAVLTSAAVLALLPVGCDRPEAFRDRTDASATLPQTGSGGFGPPWPAGGGIGGAGGSPAMGGIPGSAGRASIGGRSGAAGGAGEGMGGGGLAASGGQAGDGDQPVGGRGGTAGGGTASGGMLGNGGAAGMGGGAVASSGGAGGRVGTGGGSAGARGGSAGATGGGGAGSPGAGGAGAVLGTNPCAGLCPSPIVFTTTPYSSDALGTAETCHETTASLIGGICTNFTTRTFTINGTMISTSGPSWPPLPPKRNGGYCFQASAGTPSFASFAAY